MNQVMYFAYGSNLDGRQMRARCASAEAEARAFLPNHALAFGGFSRRWGGAVATIVPARGAQVEGLLYRLPPTELSTLDRYEGCPIAYHRLAKMVTDEHGRRRRAEVYVQPSGGLALWAPPAGYARVIRRAYRQLGFDTGRLAVALEVAR